MVSVHCSSYGTLLLLPVYVSRKSQQTTAMRIETNDS
jgi:hypothetical protein